MFYLPYARLGLEILCPLARVAFYPGQRGSFFVLLCCRSIPFPGRRPRRRHRSST